MLLEVHVVGNNIPLLISKSTMLKLGMKIDFTRHQAEVNGQVIKLQCNSSGHYCFPLLYLASENVNVVFHIKNLLSLSNEEKKKKAIKLHRQLCHAGKDRLVRLLKDSGCEDKGFLKIVVDCCENCEFCLKFKKPFSRPVVGFLVSDKFNEYVSMDLKEIKKGKLWILHLIDAATRYTAACLISRKKKELVVCRIFQIWVAYFGAPKKFHSDCGGEFANDVFREMNEKLGIETSTTPGESRFSNGVVERNNKVLYEAFIKTIEDAKCDMETALAWAVSAKNALQNHGGYSPNQLVFGTNVNLPSVITDLAPALEPFTSSEIVRRNLNTLQEARKNFIKAESSERIKRALGHNVRTYCKESYNSGDEVFYKRRAVKGWKGPATVLGKERNFVLIRHGSVFYRCHPCHLMKATQQKSVTIPDVKEATKYDDQQKKVPGNNNKVNVYSYSEDSEDDSDKDIDKESIELEEENTEAEENTVNKMGIQTDVENDGRNVSSGSSEEDNQDNDLITQGVEELKDNTFRPKSNANVQFMLKNGEKVQAKVLIKQPKRTGASKNWLNIEIVGKEDPSSVNWDEVMWWREIESEQILILREIKETSQKRQEVLEAMEREFNNLKENNVFDWVEDCGQESVSCKWVITEKQKEDGSKMLKARLVARGFEEKYMN